MIIFIIIIIILIYALITYNSLTKKKLKVEQAKSGIDVYLKQRFDLIPNLVECVKGYSKYEKTVIEEVTKLRNLYNKDKDLKIGEELNQKLHGLIAVAENNPDLKANEQFLNLQKNLSKMENQLQAARRIYNTDVTSYNISISTFPNSIIAKMFNFLHADLFEAEDEVKLNLNVDLKK